MQGYQKVTKDKMLAIRITTELWENVKKYELNPAYICTEALEKKIKMIIKEQKKLTYKKV